MRTNELLSTPGPHKHLQIQHPIPIPMEDDLVHTDDSPFCLDPTCPDKEDEAAINTVAQHVENGLFTPDEATRFAQGRQL